MFCAGEAMEMHMKFAVPGLMITAVLMTSHALAQYESPSTTATPSAMKNDSWSVKDRVKKKLQAISKHMASHKPRHLQSVLWRQCLFALRMSLLTQSGHCTSAIAFDVDRLN